MIAVHVKVDPRTTLTMGSAQSYISSEAALTTLVVAGAIGLGYSQISHRLAFTGAITDDTKATPQTDKSEQTTRKGNKKKQPKSSVVLSSDTSDKGTDNQQPLNASSVTHSAAPRRVVDAPGSFPGQFEPGASPNHQLSNVAPAVPLSSSSKSKKPKKKKAKTAVTTDPVVQEAAATSSSADHSTEILVKSKTKNAKRQQQPQPSSSASITRPLQQSTTSIDTDESWTRVGSVRRDMASSFDAPTTSDPDTGLTPQTGNSSPVAERGTESEGPSSFLLDISSRDSGDSRRKTLAEKLLPKPRKTGVDELSFFFSLFVCRETKLTTIPVICFFYIYLFSFTFLGFVSMLETPDYPTLARVIRVQPLPDEKPVSGFSWGDYEDVRVTTNGAESDADGEDDGWGVVKSKRQSLFPYY